LEDDLRTNVPVIVVELLKRILFHISCISWFLIVSELFWRNHPDSSAAAAAFCSIQPLTQTLKDKHVTKVNKALSMIQGDFEDRDTKQRDSIVKEHPTGSESVGLMLKSSPSGRL
jgi:hypothetical protein